MIDDMDFHIHIMRKNLRKRRRLDQGGIEIDRHEAVHSVIRHRHEAVHSVRKRRERDREDDHWKKKKLKFATFYGKRDQGELYLDWELKVELIFTCHELKEERKVKLATLEFLDYARFRWDQECKTRDRCGARQIEDWVDLKAIMRRRYVPSHFQRDLLNKLQRLYQGSKTVEGYFKKMEVAKN